MAIDFKAKNNPPKWKKQEFYTFTTDATNTYEFDIYSVIPIDRVKFSFGCVINQVKTATAGILVYSTLTNSFTGTLTKDGVVNPDDVAVAFIDSVRPGEGMNFIYHDKVLLQGSYQLKLYKYDGTVYSDTGDVFYMLVEYFVDE